jgi:hypothetical protein
MRSLLICLVAAFTVATTSSLPASQAEPSLEEQFRTLETRWMDALAARDVKVLEETLAREFTIIGAGSTLDDVAADRRQWLDVGLKRQFPRHDVRIVKVTRAGETAVVQCILTGEYPPMPWIPKGGTLRFLVTDTWIMRDGRWQVLARHSSLPPEAAR